MLFLIFIGILVIGIVALVLYYEVFNTPDWVGGVGVGATTIGAAGVFISLILMSCNYFGLDGYVAQMDVRHDSLVYQYENDIYDNDNDLGKRELMVDIQDWNEDLARCREHQDDLWVGIYIPNIYDQFEFIELDRGNG